jgi:hypothetical protein
MALVVNRYDNGIPNGTIPINTSSTNAKDIETAINETFLFLRANANIPDNMKINKNAVMTKILAMPKGIFNFFTKSEPVDLKQLTEDKLKNLSLEPNIDVYISTQAGGRKSRKSRKNRKSRRR